MWSICG